MRVIGKISLLVSLLLFVLLLVVAPVFYTPSVSGLPLLLGSPDGYGDAAGSSLDGRLDPVLRMLILSGLAVLFSILGVFGITVPLLFTRQRTLLGAVQFAFFAPYFLSPIVRLHSLRELVFRATQALNGGVLANFINDCLFTDAAVIIALCYSFSGFVLIPFAQSLLATSDSQLWAMMDGGFSWWRKCLLVLSFHRGSLVFGAVLMLFLGWFSALEVNVLGSGQSVLAALEGLISVRRNLEASVLSLIAFVFCASVLAVILGRVSPERLLRTGVADQ